METAWDSDHLVLTVDSGGTRSTRTRPSPNCSTGGSTASSTPRMSLRRVRVPEGLHRTFAVLANCLPEDGSLPAVIPAERAGGRTAARLLLDAGHRRARRGRRSGRHRHRGTSARLPGRAARGGLTVPEKDWIVRAAGRSPPGTQGALRLLDGVPADRRPTGVVCYNDRVAAGVLHAAARLGLDVPADLSVVGYDDQEHMAAFLSPPLTTVALPHRAMGETAARLLLDAIDSRTYAARHHPAAGVPCRQPGLGGSSAHPVTSSVRPRHGQLRRCRRRVGTRVRWPSPGPREQFQERAVDEDPYGEGLGPLGRQVTRGSRPSGHGARRCGRGSRCPRQGRAGRSALGPGRGPQQTHRRRFTCGDRQVVRVGERPTRSGAVT